jgi:hypothetical protein
VYCFHPFFGREVTVVRHTRFGGEAGCVVRIEPPGGDADDAELRIAAPCWMLDEAATAHLVLCDRPRIDLAALVRLRQLVDQLAGDAGQGHGASSLIVAKGDRHETGTRQKTRSTSQSAHAAATDD